MNKINDYTSLSVSSKGRVLLHIHRRKFLSFTAGINDLAIMLYPRYSMIYNVNTLVYWGDC